MTTIAQEQLNTFLKQQLTSTHIIKMWKTHTDFSSKTLMGFFPQHPWKMIHFRSIASNIIHYVTFKLTHKIEALTQILTWKRKKNLVKKCFLPLPFMN